jgi:hypothetical protein
MTRSTFFAVAAFLTGCTTYAPSADVDVDPDRNHPPGYDPACALGTHCNPIPIDDTPFAISGNTETSSERFADAYSCSPGTGEGGAEVWYVMEVLDAGRLTASVDEVSGDGIDVDVHLLSDADPNACLDRGDATATAEVQPGFVFVVVDTYTSSGGTEYPGPFELTVNHFSAGTGACAVEASDLRMRWSSCDAGIACYESGGERYLQLPAVGPVVKEAHLVTDDDGFGSRWPNSFTDGIRDHYALSEAETGYAMTRTEPWAPAGEGGSEYGQSATTVPLPVLDEAWYITMNWKDRPPKGTRMIVRNPDNGRAVVASAGWETGPGSNEAVAGVSEEIHHYLGTTHLDDLEVGFAADQGQPLGPVTCGGGGPSTPSNPGGTTGATPGGTPGGQSTPGTSPSSGCPSGMTCTDDFPFTHNDTTAGGSSTFDAYDCDLGIDESGPERVYQVELDEPGFLAASLSGLPSGVDVDVHILDANDPSACVDRGHWDAGALLSPGTYWVVVDSWVNGSGSSQEGAYTLTLGFTGYDDHTWAGLDPSVAEAALLAFDTAWFEGDLGVLRYGIIDYSRPSTEERFWVIDLSRGTLQFSELTSHGSGSQDPSDMRYADRFSNTNGSHMSSIGLARAAETYWGSNGYSMRLDGLDAGWNSADRSRAIVVHGASYATQDFADDTGYLGRSWGCPALDPAVNDDLIDYLADGGGLFKYYPDSAWLADSFYLQGL